MLEAGMKAPDFTLPDKDGNLVSLSDRRRQVGLHGPVQLPGLHPAGLCLCRRL